jgi:hypothetical protein
LLQYKVTSDDALLEERSNARTRYHALADAVKWVVPPAVRSPLTAWNFGAAQSALDVASYAWTATGQTDAILSGVGARVGPVKSAWESAGNAQDLVAANLLAETQLTAATDVSDAIAVANAPRDVITTIGLLGTTVPDTEPAVAAVRDIDPDTAASISAAVRSTIAEAASAGRVRIGVAGGALMLAVFALLFATVRRRRALRRVAEVAHGSPSGLADAWTTSAQMAPDASTASVSTGDASGGVASERGAELSPEPGT